MKVMSIFRRIGMYVSLTIITIAHGARYWLIRSSNPIQGVRVILVDDRRVLHVSHWYAPWAWTLPGGGVNKDESIDDAAIREVKEETGFTIQSIAGEIGVYQ